MPLRVTEVEAIARGWISAPAPPPPTHRPTSPPPERVIYVPASPARQSASPTTPPVSRGAMFYIVLAMMASWLLGFGMALMSRF